MAQNISQNKIIFSNNGNLYLDTSLTHSAFSKSRFSVKMEEEGFLAERNTERDSEKKDGSWNFSPWRFTGTQSSTIFSDIDKAELEEMSPALREMKLHETVLLEGNAFEGLTLKDFYDLQDKDSSQENLCSLTAASALVISAIESALCQHIKLEAIGGGGIFISKDFSRIIFLPQDVFTTCVSCFGDETYSSQCGLFVQPNLEGPASLNYLESVIAYRALTGTFPFTSLNTTQRHEDCLDHNFVPLRNSVYGLDRDLSFFVDNSLCRTPKINQRKKKKAGFGNISEKISDQIRQTDDGTAAPVSDAVSSAKMDFVLHFPLDTFCRETGLDSSIPNPSGKKLEPVERTARISKNDFELSSRKSFTSFQKKLSVKRWFRRKKTILTAVTAAVAIVGAFLGVWLNGIKTNPTAVSLSSFETVEMFMSSINRLDVASCQASGTGQEIHSMVNSLSTYYVASQTRSAYSGKDATVSPAEWLIHNVNTNYNIWGITQLEIEGMPGDVFFEAPKRLTHPKPIESEDGNKLLRGEQKTYSVSYKLLFNDSPEELECAVHNDTIRLEWSGKKWQVVQLNQNYVLEKCDLVQFKQDYLDALAEGRKKLDVNSADKVTETAVKSEEEEALEVEALEEGESQNLMTMIGKRNSKLVPEAEEASKILMEKYSFMPTISEIAEAREYVARTYEVDLK